MWTHFYCAGTLDSSVVLSVFVASVRAVGCAGTLALAGLWLARRGLMTPQLTKGLSQLSVKLAIPALLFSSVVPGISSDVLRYAWPSYTTVGSAVRVCSLWSPVDIQTLSLLGLCGRVFDTRSVQFIETANGYDSPPTSDELWTQNDGAQIDWK